MGFSTNECAWSHVSIKVLGRTITGLRGFEFGKSTEKEFLYGAGPKPIDIQSGNESVNGSLKLLKFEVDMINEAAKTAGYQDLTAIPHEVVSITCQFKKTATSKAQTITAAGVSFSEYKIGQDQGAKYTEVSLPFLAMEQTLS